MMLGVVRYRACPLSGPQAITRDQMMVQQLGVDRLPAGYKKTVGHDLTYPSAEGRLSGEARG